MAFVCPEKNERRQSLLSQLKDLVNNIDDKKDCCNSCCSPSPPPCAPACPAPCPRPCSAPCCPAPCPAPCCPAPCCPAPCCPAPCCPPACGTAPVPILPSCVTPVVPPCLPICTPCPPPCVPVANPCPEEQPCVPCNPPQMMVCYRMPKTTPVRRSKSRELRASVLYTTCDCIKRNGLQDDCPRSECHGQPECLTLPEPSCGPAEAARTFTISKFGKNKNLEQYQCYPAYVKLPGGPSPCAPPCCPPGCCGPCVPLLAAPPCPPPICPCAPPALPIGNREKAPRRTQGQKSQNSNPSASNSKYGAFHIESEKNVLAGLSDEATWILDSGASAHMHTSNKRLFTELREIDEFSVRIGNNEELPVKGIGTINIQCWIRERWIENMITDVWYVPGLHKNNGCVRKMDRKYDNGCVVCTWTTQESILRRCSDKVENMITDVWYVPGLHKNLFSEGAVTRKGMQVTKSNDMAEIHHDGQLKACAIRGTNNLYTLLFRITDPEANLTISASLKLWHERMGHINVKTIREMITKGLINGVKLADVEHFVCEGCQYGKQHKLSYHSSQRRLTKPGEFIHTDLCGPMSLASVSGSMYFVLFKDYCTGYRSVYFMKHKSDTLECFKEYIKFCKNKLGYKTVTLRADNGTEFVNSEFKRFLMDKGIQLETSAPYCHEQNGAAEREIRTIVESARSMLYTKDLPLYLWAEAVNTSVYILNRTPNVHTPNSTPFELWTGRKPLLNHLKVFGSEVFMHIPDNLCKKPEPKSRKLILVGYDNDSTNYLGYDNDSTNYRLFDIVTKKIRISRNVTFNENNGVTIPRTNQIIVQVNNDEIVENVDQETIIKVEQEDEYRRNGTKQLRPRENIQKPKRYEVNLIEADVPETYEEARKLILVGYDNDSTNYRLFDIVTKKIRISRNVTFNENNGVTIPRTNQIIVQVNNDEIIENVDQETIIKVEQEDEYRRNGTKQLRPRENIVEQEDEYRRNGTKQLRPRENIQKPKRYEVNLIEADVPETYEEAVSAYLYQ
ncbi:GAG-pre-integrase domain [Popillia japonica]|uniref:GAG-pre-integrase domain n=1 Tax=Popillia japonica TaxID=7064 RepID=A0AAW1IXP1_POPJA